MILQIYIRLITPGSSSRRIVYVYEIELKVFHMMKNDGY